MKKVLLNFSIFDFVQMFVITTVNATTKTFQRNARIIAIATIGME